MRDIVPHGYDLFRSKSLQLDDLIFGVVREVQW